MRSSPRRAPIRGLTSLVRASLLMLAVGLGALPLAGCYRSHVGLGGDGDAAVIRVDGAMRDGGVRDAGGPVTPSPRQIDLLFVVDSSNSMGEEQAALAAELPRMLDILVTGDFDQDGTRTGPEDFVPVESVHLGVITTDMGVGGFEVFTCNRPEFGDDGRLDRRSDAPAACRAEPPFVQFDPGSDLARDSEIAACLTSVGVGGCGFEQPLEATLKALSPSAPTPGVAGGFEAPTFYRGTFGHADADNFGFVREGSVLAVITVTDENDCSARDQELFDPESPRYEIDLNLRCSEAPEALQPVDRYIRGLLQLRRDPSRFAYAAIAGVPPELQGPATAARCQEILDDPRMREVIDPDSAVRLVPSCESEGGIAFPPGRLVETACGLAVGGARASLHSICAPDFAQALRGAVDALD